MRKRWKPGVNKPTSQAALSFEHLECRQLLAVITVESPLDNFDPTAPTLDGVVTLREAILAANADAPVGDAPAGNGADTINFGPMMSPTITLSGGRELLITDTLTVDASNGARTIDANMNSRVIHAMGDLDLTLLGITIQNGRDSDNVGTPGSFGKGGGGIRFDSEGTLTIIDGTVVGNSTDMVSLGNGGAIHSQGEVVLVDSSIQSNFTTGSNAYGGAIWSTGLVSATNTQFVGNYTEGVGSRGGAIHGRVTLTDSQVVGNYTLGDSAEGGGIRGGTVTLWNSTVTQNATHGLGARGAGIYTTFGDIQVTDSIVSGNLALSSNSGGGAIWTRYGDVDILRSDVSENVANSRGGGIYAFYGDLFITDSVISGNTTQGQFSGGGGLFSYDGEFRISNSTVSGNSTKGDDAWGGGIYSVSDVTLLNSTVTGNSTSGDYSPGGGIFVRSGNLTVSSSTVTDNHTAGSNSHGGGLNTSESFLQSALLVENSIVAGNSVAAGSWGPDFLPNADRVLTVEYSLVGDNANTGLQETQSADANGNLIGGAVGGLINARLGPLSDNGGPTQTHQPLADSPTLDAGDPGAVAGVDGIPLTDQRGFARIVGTRIDMGAVEFTVGAGDFTGDGLYDCQDIDELTAQIAANSNDAAFDLTGDGIVDTDDRDAWLAEAGSANVGSAFLLGDATLDGRVDGADFLAWNANKFTDVAAWCAGDFTADGTVDGADFLLWNANKFQSSSSRVIVTQSEAGTVRPGKAATDLHHLISAERPSSDTFQVDRAGLTLTRSAPPATRPKSANAVDAAFRELGRDQIDADLQLGAKTDDLELDLLL